MEVFENSGEIPIKYTGVCFIRSLNEEHHYLNGEYHRLDGPSVRHMWGSEWWHLNGKVHRVGGPAIKTAHKEQFCLFGLEYSEQEYWKHPLLIEYKLNKLLGLSINHK